MRLWIVLILSLSILTGCKKKEEIPEGPPPLPDISGKFVITKGKNTHKVYLAPAGEKDQYRLSPKNLVYQGLYQFNGKQLTMIGENHGYKDLVWHMNDVDNFEMVAGSYIGAKMARQK
jgi:hypothetical protein